MRSAPGACLRLASMYKVFPEAKPLRLPGGWVTANLLVVFSMGVAQAQPGSGQIVERVMAVINGQPITLSELEFEARVALGQRGAVRALLAPLDDEALASSLEYAIAQRLQAEEAARMEAFAVPPADVQVAVRAFKERFESEAAYQAFLARHEVEEAQLATVLERSLRADRALEARVRLRAQVSEAELRAYYAAHEADLRRPYEEVRPALREKLQRERARRLAAQEIEKLRRANDVRWLAPFPRPKGGKS